MNDVDTTVQTVAERKAAVIEQLNALHNRILDALKAEHEARIAWVKQWPCPTSDLRNRYMQAVEKREMLESLYYEVRNA